MAKRRHTRTRRPQPDYAEYVTRPELETEIANRLVDPFEPLYMGVLRTNDPLLLERGQGSIAIYRDLRRDGKVFACMQKRRLALISYDWSVTPVTSSTKADADAKTLSDILKQVSFDSLCSQMLEANLTGMEVFEKVWTVRDGMVVPDRIVKRAQRRFVYVQDDPNQPPTLRMLTREDMLRGIALPDRKFIVHRVNPEDDNPYGTGLGLQTYWPVFFKRAGIIAWNKRLSRSGSPVPWGKYPNNASPKEKNTLFDALRAMSNDGVLMTPSGMDISLLESKLASAGGISSERELAEYMDDWIAEVWTGEVPRGKSGGAVAAASNERESVRLGLTKGDSDLLSETLKSQLLDDICFYNGLEPCQVYRNIRAAADLKSQSETDKNVAEMGFEPSEAYVQERYGEGWTKKPAPAPSASGPTSGTRPAAAPAAFAEPGDEAQNAIDAAIAAVPDTELQDALAGIFEPLLAAIEGAATYEDALAAAQAAYPEMDGTKLQVLIANAIFGAETYGRATGD
ncbi:DUF935 domain-containing protein [Burkholderia orbicola]|uniref:DUF935 domain-containing protein n=1 Tax=Burkholderia orbicola TaxID=2978683 RepID=UPI002650E839|nr:DUF935 family protein [Burkholderia orbicola]MDN7533830.1 DUF935 family protein [Burkholderia orbicola]